MVMGYDKGRGRGGGGAGGGVDDTGGDGRDDGGRGQLFYVDSDGARVKGRYFSVG